MAMMSWTQLIKRFIALDVVWGSRTKKAHGINDRANYLADTAGTYDAGTNTLTLSNQTVLPKWIKKGKFLRIYDGTLKAVTGSQSATYIADAIIIPNAGNNDGVKLLVDTVVGNVITFDTAEAVVVNRVLASDFVIDGRIAISINDELISRINAYGSTVYNTQNEQWTQDDEGSGVAQIFADHFHDSPDDVNYPVKQCFSFGDWFSTDAGDTWSIDVAHNLASSSLTISTWEGIEETHLHDIRMIDDNTLRIKVTQEGSDCRFAGCIVIKN